MPSGPEFHDFVQWGFYSLIAFCSVYGVNKLTKIEHKIEDALVNDARLMERDNHQQKEIEEQKRENKRLELRIQRLEHKRG